MRCQAAEGAMLHGRGLDIGILPHGAGVSAKYSEVLKRQATQGGPCLRGVHL